MAIYYIDPINGKSENSGLSENEPLLTNENLDIKPGDKVLFKRGSFVRGRINNRPGAPGNPTYYGAYGEGPMPTFCASKNLTDEKYWKDLGGNIWVCEDFDTLEVCNIIFNGTNMFGTLRWSLEEKKLYLFWTTLKKKLKMQLILKILLFIMKLMNNLMKF